MRKLYTASLFLFFFGLFSFGQGSINASDDFFDTQSGSTTTSILDNDTLNGSPVSSDDVTITIINIDSGFTLNMDGTISIDSNVPSGNYSFFYDICDISSLLDCDSAIITINISSNLAVSSIETYSEYNPNFTFNDFKVFPNPTKNSLTISNEFAIDEVEITSILGQKMITKKVNDLQTTIDTSELSNGIYFVKVSSQGNEKTVKIVKE